MEPNEQNSTIIDWVFRGFSTMGPLIAVVFGYIMRLNANRIDTITGRLDSSENMAQQNRLDIKDTELSMANLKTHIAENFSNKLDIQSSLARIHEKIEDGNKKTDEGNEKMNNKIDQLRRDLQSDIRNAIAVRSVSP